MPRLQIRLTAIASALSALIVAGCGGGSNTGVAETPLVPVEFTGVAATGAPMARARVDVFDRHGVSICATTAEDDGIYRCTLPASAAAPFVLKAAQDGLELFSTFAEARSSIVNVTPITNLIAALLSSNGDPGQLMRDVASDAGALTLAKLQARTEEVRAALQPLLTAAAANADPLTGSFRADGTGLDLVLDSLQISIRSIGTSANVEITVKSRPEQPDSPPVAVRFNTSQATAVPQLPVLRAEDLVASGTAVRLADMVQRLNACYALPVTERVSGSSVSAPACRSLFVGDDPAAFLHDGRRVGPGAAFAGMFSGPATGVRFDRPTLEYLQANGELVLSYRSTTTSGNIDFGFLQGRLVGDQLKLVGNQAAYSASVMPKIGERTFINALSTSYRSTGYSMTVGNRLDANGQPLFAKVEVTAPNGRVFRLLPRPGLSYLAIERDNGAPSVTNTIFLAARFLDAQSTSLFGNPADKDRDPVFASVQLTEDELAALPDQGVWKFDFFHADGVTPNAVQNVRTMKRAPTMSESMVHPIARATEAAVAALVSASEPGGIVIKTAATVDVPNWVNFSVNGADFWTVPDGATAPYLVSAFGYSPGQSVFFNDNTAVLSTARQAKLDCTAQTLADTHCEASNPGSYAVGTRFTSLELLARTQQRLEVQQLLALWIMP